MRINDILRTNLLIYTLGYMSCAKCQIQDHVLICRRLGCFGKARKNSGGKAEYREMEIVRL